MSITDLEDFEGCGSLPNPTPPPTTNVQWYIKDGTWWLGDYNSGVQAEGEEGLSAYEIAVRNGFVGTEQEWVNGILAGYLHSLMTGNPHDTQIEDIPGLAEAISQAGKVKSVNGIEPDPDDGNIELEFDDLLNKPTTASGYGITNVYTKTEVDTNVVHKTGNLAETITGPKTFSDTTTFATGTDTVAPAIIPEGEVLTTPIDGAVERDEDGYFFVTKGTTRHNLLEPSSVKNSKDDTGIKFWTGTQLEYDAILVLDGATIYFIKD